MHGCQPAVLLFASPEDIKGDARINLEILQKMNAPIRVITEESCTEEYIRRIFNDLGADLFIDAFLGTGVRLPLSPQCVAIIQSLRHFRRVVAIDIPSGLNCEDFILENGSLTAPQAELTVTFTALKPPHVFHPGAAFVGKWVTVPIGTPLELLEDTRHWLNAVSASEAARSLGRLVRPPDSHKWSFG